MAKYKQFQLCDHESVGCLNQHELIRKYRCDDCGAVMMCSCDEDIGTRFLSHQLSEGQDYETKDRVPVTHGFVKGICNPCRGLPETPSPRAQMHGCTTKIQRYYWREISFARMTEVAAWRALNETASPSDVESAVRQIRKDVIRRIRQQHEENPKYSYTEESEDSLIKRLGVCVERVRASYVYSNDRKVLVLDSSSNPVRVEDFAAEYYRNQGFQVVHAESSPFHVLFAVYFWMLIQDAFDPRVRAVQFGRRDHFDEGRQPELMWCLLPDDFGSSGYAARRSEDIDAHFADNFCDDHQDWVHLFDYWLETSEGLRQYLWAHRSDTVSTARRIVEMLSPLQLRSVLRYLIASYWERYLGWPDLLIAKDGSVQFVEVKSARDKLSEGQKRWIEDNGRYLGFTFKVLKIHKDTLSAQVQTDAHKVENEQ